MWPSDSVDLALREIPVAAKFAAKRVDGPVDRSVQC